MLILALPSYFTYQYQYNYAKAILDNPNDDHLHVCGGDLTPTLCKVELPELSALTILGIAIGLPLMIVGAAICVASYARYEPKPIPVHPPSSSEGAPFK